MPSHTAVRGFPNETADRRRSRRGQFCAAAFPTSQVGGQVSSSAPLLVGAGVEETDAGTVARHSEQEAVMPTRPHAQWALGRLIVHKHQSFGSTASCNTQDDGKRKKTALSTQRQSCCYLLEELSSPSSCPRTHYDRAVESVPRNTNKWMCKALPTRRTGSTAQPVQCCCRFCISDCGELQQMWRTPCHAAQGKVRARRHKRLLLDSAGKHTVHMRNQATRPQSTAHSPGAGTQSRYTPVPKRGLECTPFELSEQFQSCRGGHGQSSE